MTDFVQEGAERRGSTPSSSEPVQSRDSEAEELRRSRTDIARDPTSEFHEDPRGLVHEKPGDEVSSTTPLFPAGESDSFRSRWMEIQTDFVDEPRQSVKEADALVNEVTERLMSAFTRNRDELERQWSAGGDVSTEDLRRTLQHYRSFFERLLSI